MIASIFLRLTILLLLHQVSANQNQHTTHHRDSILHERASLMSFRTTLTAQSQAVLSNWNETTHVCRFIGVVCNKWRLHVTRLLLPGMNLVGHISPVLTNLTGLHDINFSENGFYGRIPSELSELRHLISIDLSSNQLCGEVPKFLSNISSLQNLDLHNNNFVGRVPSELSELMNLQAIDLSSNQLDGPVPRSFSKLSGIKYLNLGNNSLEGRIPTSVLQNCTELEFLYLHSNALIGEIPSAHGIYLRDLFVFDLYSNNLTGRLPAWLSNSTSLYELDVENNFLSGELPIKIISNKKLLRVLHLSSNGFSSFSNNTNLEPFFVTLSNCSSLEEIEMGSLNLGGQLPKTLLTAPKSLSIIHLEDNMITGSIPPDIGDLYNLTLLNLSSNLIGGTIPSSIGNLLKMERLILSNNSLTGVIPVEIGNLSSIGVLDLSSNFLSGEIPESIGNLIHVNDILLQRNRFTGKIPVSLERCVSLNKLDLSYNRLNGTIPEEISGIVKRFFNLSNNQLEGPLPVSLSKMYMVEEIDISCNNLTGEITTRLSGCVEVSRINLSHNSLQGDISSSFKELVGLEILDLSFNHLSGEIPLSLNGCRSLTYLNLSYNEFSGFIPTDGIFSLFTNLSYIGNPHLCGLLIGRPCTYKHQGWLASRNFLILLSVGASILAFLLTIIIVIGIRKCKEKMPTIRNGTFRRSSSPDVKSKYPRITYRELIEATNEFSQDRLIGSGSYGRVYKGVVQDGSLVAVKVLQFQAGNSMKSFTRECQVLKRIRHRNLMRIITACSLPDFKALVLPFMANGSLDRCLYSRSIELSLVQRVNICSDIAEGMAYLHHYSPVKVIHCDLKPSNVLLNDDMTALVSDFGISRLIMSVEVGGTASIENVGTSTANMLCGSIGYIAPEYGFGSNASSKGDVYSFGVLVLEVVTKRRPTDEMFEGGLNLHEWVRRQYHGRVESVIDPILARLVRDQIPEVRRMWEVAISELLELGILCTQETPSLRPTMLDAADDLDRLKNYLAGDTATTFASSFGFSSVTFGDD
ncbi:hypothetical protein LUZ60_002897 [Juncus effusus]|nr:hypothetical protein LUZ60_002897 [Juncus effusus]